MEHTCTAALNLSIHRTLSRRQQQRVPAFRDRQARLRRMDAPPRPSSPTQPNPTHPPTHPSRNGTSMISLIIPPRDQVSRVNKMLADEYGTATNIKSRTNRLSVLDAITSTQQRLKLYSKVR